MPVQVDERGSEIVVSGRGIRRDCERRLMRLDRFRVPPEGLKRGAETVMCYRAVRLEPDRLPIRCDSLFVTLDAAQRIAELEMRFRVLRIYRNGATQQIERPRRLPPAQGNLTKAEKRVELI